MLRTTPVTIAILLCTFFAGAETVSLKGIVKNKRNGGYSGSKGSPDQHTRTFGHDGSGWYFHTHRIHFSDKTVQNTQWTDSIHDQRQYHRHRTVGQPVSTYRGRGHDCVSCDCKYGMPGHGALVSGTVKITNRRYAVDLDMETLCIFCSFGGFMPDSHTFRLIDGKIRLVHTLSVQ